MQPFFCIKTTADEETFQLYYYNLNNLYLLDLHTEASVSFGECFFFSFANAQVLSHPKKILHEFLLGDSKAIQLLFNYNSKVWTFWEHSESIFSFFSSNVFLWVLAFLGLKSQLHLLQWGEVRWRSIMIFIEFIHWGKFCQYPFSADPCEHCI